MKPHSQSFYYEAFYLLSLNPPMSLLNAETSTSTLFKLLLTQIDKTKTLKPHPLIAKTKYFTPTHQTSPKPRYSKTAVPISGMCTHCQHRTTTVKLNTIAYLFTQTTPKSDLTSFTFMFKTRAPKTCTDLPFFLDIQILLYPSHTSAALWYSLPLTHEPNPLLLISLILNIVVPGRRLLENTPH